MTALNSCEIMFTLVHLLCVGLHLILTSLVVLFFFISNVVYSLVFMYSLLTLATIHSNLIGLSLCCVILVPSVSLSLYMHSS